MTEFPRITIITPSYNQGKYLEATIQSILNQNYPNLEYFVIDGGSTDESVEIIKKYESQIDYWVSEKDNGQSHAINKGLERATGDIINWINSDDQLTEESLFTIAKYFQSNPGVAVVHGKTILFQEDGWETVRGADENDLPEGYLAGILFPQPSAFFTKEALDRVGGKVDQSLHFGMDCDLFGKMALHYSFLSVPDIFSKYLLHDASKTSQSNLPFAKDWQKIFCRIISSIPNIDQKYILQLKELAIWHKPEQKDTMVASVSFSDELLNNMFCLFIRIQLFYHYEDNLFSDADKLAQFLKEKHPTYYHSQNLNRLHSKLKLPFRSSLIPFLRKLKRN
jgi:glycosyltransferase involved in cell wall biosynthesis